jgi:uncharacterized damage-inducible protein DinB
MSQPWTTLFSINREVLMETMADTQAALNAAFSSADWDEPQFHPAFQATLPLVQIVGTLFVHETYHLGQLGTARKLLGLPGVIKPPATANT